MTQLKLMGELKRCGMARFVLHFELFRDYARGTILREDCYDELRRHGCYGGGPGWKSGAAKRIFEAGKEQKALEVICEAKRVGEDVRRKARKLSTQNAGRP